MAAKIAVVSQKGGVGKTTVVLNLGLALAEKHKVLLVDVDPQGGIGLSLGRADQAWTGLAEVLMGNTPLDKAIVQTKQSKLAILSRGRLDPIDTCEFEMALHSPGVLQKVFDEAAQSYDYVLVDTPAGTGMICRGALSAADFALVPFQAEPLAMRSIGQILHVIERVRESENPNLNLLGILPTMVDASNLASKTALWNMWSGVSGVLDNHIPRSEAFTKASEAGVPVAYLGGTSRPETRRFAALAVEVENLVEKFTAKEGDDVGTIRELV